MADYAIEDTTYYIVFKKIKGMNLQSYIQIFGPQYETKDYLRFIFRVFEEQLECLNQLNFKKIFHQDLKPDNFMIETAEEITGPLSHKDKFKIIIIDFGSSWGFSSVYSFKDGNTFY